MVDVNPTRQAQLAMGAAIAVNLTYAAAISALALTPSPPPIGGSDWLLHGLTFGVQTLLLYALVRQRWTRFQSLASAAAGALLYGGVIEVLQLLVPGRYFELSDLIANAGGVLLGSGLLLLLSRGRRRESLRELSG